jgi:2-methylcitrate dehydratase PrpD
MSVTRALAAAAIELSIKDIPADVQSAGCRHLLDGVGTALAATRTGASIPALRVAQKLGGAPTVRLFRSEVSPSHVAGFGMAAAVHALDFDDTHARALIHPTTVVLPAALSVGREIGSSGAEILEAAIVGYEIGCRLGAASPFGFHAAGVHATSAVGVVAAAAVTAKLLSLPLPAFSNALSIAASIAGGLLESLGTGTKQLHPAFAVSNGILAAQLASAGADGADTALEGKHGLYSTHSQRAAHPEGATNGFGTRWEVTQISIKPYPCCQLMHSSLDAAAKARTELRSAPTDITRIDVHAHPDSLSIVGKTDAPRDPNDAKFSLAWTVAALLIEGAVTIDTFTPEMLIRDDITALAGRVTAHEARDSDVAASSGAQVILHAGAGQTAEGRVPCSKGTPELPLTLAELREKFYANCGGASESAVHAADWILALHEQGTVEELVALTELLLAG